MLQTKALTIESVDAAGKGRARLAQLSAIDSDGDTYQPGAFSWPEGGGQWVMMIPAHDRRAMPFGKAWVFEEGDWALADFTLNLDTEAGRQWYAALKFDLKTGEPVQEYSYGYQTLDADSAQRGSAWSRRLKKLKLDEISPVLRGAGVGTGTIAIKSAELKEAKFAPLIADLGELAAAIGEDPSHLSATGLKQLGEIYEALGKALTPAPGDGLAEDTALAQFLMLEARKHLPSPV